MCKLFDIAYTVAYCGQPFRLFKTLVSVERKHGVELGVTYHNSRACRIFIEHIAGTMSDHLHALVKHKPFYCSLLFDGSMDKSTSEKEVVSIKLIENGTPRIRLLGFTEPES
ncbi:Zinc finger protein 862 [Dissostichus eleginoides]|uniref:Zinc finger protein 862 n=1 Tax=Dissostichus eleginoides TaxID=100907 RepID=A0AAD9FE55_DISEL|nr:Zinc finger protein 862 [Dissostichus eleginoides]